MRHVMRLVVVCAGVLSLVTAGGPALAGALDAPGFTKAFSCSACHGFAGQSQADSMPILAGMQAAYLKKAIFDYAAGRRPSAEMEPFARMVLELSVDEVAAYFAAQTFQPTPQRVDPAAAARGQLAAKECVICHGADGRGDVEKTIPSLRGQPPGYLQSQMRLFKQEARSPGDERIRAMKTLMKTISDTAIADLAAYYASLR